MTELQIVELDALIRLYNTLRVEPSRSHIGYSSTGLINIKSDLEQKEEELLGTILCKMEALVLTDTELVEIDNSACINKEDMEMMLQLNPDAKAYNIKWQEDQFIFFKDGRYYTEELEEFNDLDQHYPNEDEWLIFT